MLMVCVCVCVWLCVCVCVCGWLSVCGEVYVRDVGFEALGVAVALEV